MVGKKQRKSRRQKLLEKDSEEKLMQRSAKIREMLSQANSEERYHFTDSSNEENSEAEINQRTRLGSPFKAVRSLSPDSESCDEAHRLDGDHDNWGNQPFYCLPAKKIHSSASKGYSQSFDANFYTRTKIKENYDFFKNLRSKEKNVPTKSTEDVWVPLTFLDPDEENFVSPLADSKPVSRSKIPDLRRRVIEIERPPEEISEPEVFEAKHRALKSEGKRKKLRNTEIEPSRKLRRSSESIFRTNSGISDSEFLETPKQEVNFENSSEKMKKRGTDSYRRYSAESDSSSRCRTSNPPKKEINIENSPERMKKRGTDSYRRYSVEILELSQQEISIENPSKEIRKAETNSSENFRICEELNSDSHSGTLEPLQQDIQVENPPEESNLEDFKPLGIIPTDLLFRACISIAAEIPEEALLPLKNLQIPTLEVKAEEPEGINIKNDNYEISRSASREIEFENVEEDSLEDTESVASKEKIFEAVVKSLIEEKLQEPVKTKSREENSRESSVEKSENFGKKEIDFGKEIEKFTIKLRIIKSVEEKLKEF